MKERAANEADTAPTGGGGVRSPGPVLRGTPVAPGLALGRLRRVEEDPFEVGPRRVPLDRVETELNRFHRALGEAQAELGELRERLSGRVPEGHVRILDTHVAYLRDSVFVSDVENQILNEQMSLEAALGKVVADFDRIFRLVESEALRERAVDLRDVGVRVLRCLERELVDVPPVAQPAEGDAILVARELSIVDLFGAAGEGVLGIVTQEGGPASHAALLARSIGIPVMVGVEGLLDEAEAGDFAILDASEGVLRLRPEERLVRQYREVEPERHRAPSGEPPEWMREELRTADGYEIAIAASCGNLPQVERAADLAAPAIGLYRTELLYLIDAREPSFESLVSHYDAVLDKAAGRAVTFRLLSVDSSLELDFLHEGREPNPALGRVGVRALLAHENVLRRQLRAILCARPGAPRRVSVPFVTDPGEVRRVLELVEEERWSARQQGLAPEAELEVGAIVETPAAALQAAGLAEVSGHLLLSLDGLTQYLLAADRENRELGEAWNPQHPVVLRVVADVARAAGEAGRPLSVFGSLAARPSTLPALLGAGVRGLVVAPDDLKDVVEGIRGLALVRCQAPT